MSILLSIHPRYVQAIMDGRKRYEFRKRRFSRRDGHKAFIYSTHPVRMIVGTFTVGTVHEGSPKGLWARFGRAAGMKKGEFFSYYQDFAEGYAIEIIAPRHLRRPIDPRVEYVGFTAPQDFCYMDRLVRRKRGR
jgi:predicted transcriptional regulator